MLVALCCIGDFYSRGAHWFTICSVRVSTVITLNLKTLRNNDIPTEYRCFLTKLNRHL